MGLFYCATNAWISRPEKRYYYYLICIGPTIRLKADDDLEAEKQRFF
jgi:hypothetical protein